MSTALSGFAAADFSAWRPPDDIWTDSAFDVAGLHEDLADRLVAEFFARTRTPETMATGQTLLGVAGSGKTHLFSILRRRVWEGGGWVVRIDAIGVEDFWGAAVLSFLDSLSRRMKSGGTQASAVTLAVLKKVSENPSARAVAASRAREPLNKAGAVDLLLAMLAAVSPTEAAEHGDVVRAVALLEARDPTTSAFATRWLQGEAGDPARQRVLGFHGAPPPAADIAQGLVWLLSLAGPTLVVVDGLDSLVAQAGSGAPRANAGLDALAAGLAKLQTLRRRTLVVISCLPESWPALAQRLPPGSFRNGRTLPPIERASVVERLIAARLAPAYAQMGFTPPSPTSPFSRAAIESGVGMTPREALSRCRRHQEECLAENALRVCDSLTAPLRPLPAVWRDREMEACDAAYARALAEAKSPNGEDRSRVALLAAACALLRRQLDLPPSVDACGGPVSAASPLHAAFTIVLRDGGERQERWGFLFCEDEDRVAFAARLKAARLAAGVQAGLAGRRLVVLRKTPPPEGSEPYDGVVVIAPKDEDFAIFAALRRVAQAAPSGFAFWLLKRKPLLSTSLFQEAKLAPPEFLPRARAEASPVVAAALAPPPPPVTPEVHVSRALILGRAAQAGAFVGPVTLPASPPPHVAVLADAAKPAILRRLIEEAVIAGLPVVAIDGAGDLTRLGEPWPSRPAEFSDDDARRARLYFERADAVVWTPGLDEGRPIAFDPLPDFAAFGQDASGVEAREQAIEMAIAALEPHLVGSGAKAIKQRGALADSLRYFARSGGSFDQFLGLLADLPAGASRIADAESLARDVAGQLLAASATGGLANSDAPPFDPAELFEGAPGKTRVSVVSLAGLPNDASRAAFVSQLQTALFGWIARRPNATGRMYVIDEARLVAPIRENPPSKRSALFLAKRASHNGLGMIVGAREPQAVDQTLLKLCGAQILGGATPLAGLEGLWTEGEAPEVAALKPGEIYVSAEGLPRALKVRMPPAFSRRAQKPPSPEEIAALARRRM